jgi:GH25 family lysozyme M1 (1,4-beta-N-acetylmuramidase)
MSTNLTRATQAGVITGVYHYAHAENRPTTAGAVLEADHFMNYAGSAIGPGHLRPALDLEGSSLSLNTATLTAWVIAFVNRVAEVKGIDAAPMIYTSSSVTQSKLDSRIANYDLWVANWNGANPQTGTPSTGNFNNWVIWQYTNGGNINGVGMDLDVVHSEYRPLLSLVTPLDGDFNRDGFVNTADYVLWRKNNLGQADYNLWKKNYGTALPGFQPVVTPPRGSGDPRSAPEPASISMAACLLLLSGTARVRKSARRH